MTITKLAWRDLVPDTESYQEIFAQPHVTEENDTLLSDTQPRLQFALEQLLQPRASSPFMLAKAPEELEYLNLLADAARALQHNAGHLILSFISPSTMFCHSNEGRFVNHNFHPIRTLWKLEPASRKVKYGGRKTVQSSSIKRGREGVLNE